MADVSDLEQAVRARARELVSEAANVTFNQTRDQAPVATGALRESIHYEEFDEGDTLGADITADAPQAEWTDQGTQAHTITGNPLAFYWRDGPSGPHVYFFRSVNHPGNRAQNWFEAPMADRWRIALENAAS